MTAFVLVPGAWLGSWAWREVAADLVRHGHTAYPVTLTGMGERVHLLSKEVGMETAVLDVLNVIKFNELRSFVVVGHSFAGKVAAAVADRDPASVTKAIYVDALRPERVRTPQGGFDPTKEFGPSPPGGLGIPLKQATIDLIGSDLAGAPLERMRALATPWPIRMATDPITLSPAYDAVQEAYVLCSKSGDPVDEIIEGKWGKLEGPHRVIECGHWPMLTQPEKLATDLIALAR